MSKIFKNRMPLSMMMALVFFISFMTQSFIYASGGGETSSGDSSSGDSSSSDTSNISPAEGFAAFPEDMTAIKSAIDQYFTTTNPNMSEKVIKSVDMQMKRASGMTMKVVLDRNLINKILMGAYVYDNGKVQFKTENTSPTSKAILVTKENLDSISRYVLSKIFTYDADNKLFQITNLESPDFKGLASYIQSAKINNNPELSNLVNLEAFIQFFISDQVDIENIMIGADKAAAERNFLINWIYQDGSNPISPSLMGYYDTAVFTDSSPLQTIMNNIYTLEGISYPANNDNDNPTPTTGPPQINAYFFPIPVFKNLNGTWMINNNSTPYVSLERGLQDYTGSIAKASIQKVLDSLSYQSIIPASGDLSFTFSINTENLFKALGATEKYKGASPIVP